MNTKKTAAAKPVDTRYTLRLTPMQHGKLVELDRIRKRRVPGAMRKAFDVALEKIAGAQPGKPVLKITVK